MATHILHRILSLPIIILLIQLSIASTQDVVDCKPDCTGKQPGDKVPDPTNCRQFYFCDGSNEPSSVPFSCEDGYVFNDTEGECVVGNTCSNKGCSSCFYSCDDAVDIASVADHYDCSIYYECPGNVEQQCASGKYFDGSSCQSDKTKCCNCKPYCTENDLYTLVIDPKDCKRYYYCDVVGIPEYSQQCEEGNFDIMNKVCSDTTPCITFCPDE
nr:uncharacterized protein LOC128704800 [Cherax quadricarinatus]